MYDRSLIVFSSATKLINAKYFIKIRHVVRIFCNSINMLAAFLIMAFIASFGHTKVAFFISLASSVLMGISSALGESVNLGFCKGFPSEVVGYYGSGTGFAGIFGTSIILILKAGGLNNGTIFFIVAPTVIPYFIAFYWLHRTKTKHPYIAPDALRSPDTEASDYNTH